MVVRTGQGVSETLNSKVICGHLMASCHTWHVDSRSGMWRMRQDASWAI